MPSTSRPVRSRPLAAVTLIMVGAVAGAMAMIGCAQDGPAATVATTGSVAPTTEPAPTGHRTDERADVPAGLDLFVHQPRYLQGRSRLAIAVTNGRDAPIVVRQLALRAQHFEPLAAEPKASTIAPGARTDLQLDVGDTACDDRGPLTATVELELTVDGTTGWHTAVLDTELLDRLRDAECAERAVADAVTIDFGDDPTVSDGRVHTEIVLARVAGTRQIRVESIRGSVVFVMLADGVASDAAPRPLRVIGPDEAGDAPVSIPVEITVSRCDPHVIGQAQRPHDFRVWVSVGDDDTVLVGLEPSTALVARLDEIVASCEPGRPN